MPIRGPDTDVLLERIQRGDAGARDQLLLRHRPRLKRLVALRLAGTHTPRDLPSLKKVCAVSPVLELEACVRALERRSRR